MCSCFSPLLKAIDAYVLASGIESQFDPETVTWNTRPTYSDKSFSGTRLYSGYGSVSVDDAGIVALLLRYGAMTAFGADTTVQTPASASNRPYINVTFDDTIVGLDVECIPQSGSYPKNQPTTFSWTNIQNGDCYADVNQSAAVFRWRAEASAVATEIALTSVTSVTIPAGTFSTDKIQWQVQVTANSGIVTTSEWFTISTTGPRSNTVPVSPVSTAVDGNAAITFHWKNVISTGAEQTGADVQTSTDGSAWIALAHVDGSQGEYTVPAGTFTAGPLYWRARTYIGGEAGLWSDAASVIIISAPTASISSVSQTPRPTVSWQAEGQQAFEVRVDDYDSGSVFGTDKRWQYPEYLSDGTHTVGVRVQNLYGLWSEWAETVIVVENMPGEAPTLTVQGTLSAFLSWSEAAGAVGYRVYRDGEFLSETEALNCVDRYSIGDVSYFVRAVYDGSGNYTDSAEVHITLKTAWPLITAMDGDWIHLRANTTTLPETQITHQSEVTLQHFAGSAYPIPEVSERRQKSYTFSAAFKAGSDDISRFRALLGREVFLKDQYGNAIYGIMSSISEIASKFYTVFRASVAQIEGAP